MELQRILLYVGTLFILISIFWTLFLESNKHNIINQLISKGLPTPAYANVSQLQKINNSN
jgi:hypothetical protein